ncbi:protein-L-isoaspartate(D-aspartate) O-methyltransferase [Nitrosomonas communis]|uniref:protein-L-isoaspartate(D-aspartate) O-methyltransferase n=1 Tax=Nitrosomonas communis TaxID=44574 RepID=UPI0026EC28A3|nr:protein-L-isoaspartate(D-aspartate) O-methyltransferase [Nitrosomonas communis]
MNSPARALTSLRITSIMLIHCLAVMAGCSGISRGDSLFADSARQAERDRMVDEQIVSSGVKDSVVLTAMRRVPRHKFVPARYSTIAYHDVPLPISHGQTISQPSLVALMTEKLALQGAKKVLEIGTGSGYQAAVLAEIVPHVFTIEIIEPLMTEATRTLTELGYRNIHTRVGDGYQGWPEEAPFDAIIVTAAIDHVPQPLLDQLAVGGRLILPIGRYYQTLELYRRTAEGYERKIITLVRFVPLVREQQQE